MAAPRFLSFEGIEGSGKTTQVARLASALAEEGHAVLLVREPGGTDLSERVRDILLDPALAATDPWSELALYVAARAQLVAERIAPALRSGQLVLADRFGDSSVVYQGVARGLGVERVEALNSWATGGLTPALTVLFDLDPEVGLARVAARGRKDRLEAEPLSFHRRVREGYLELARNHRERFVVLDASQPEDVVHAELRSAVGAHLRGPVPNSAGCEGDGFVVLRPDRERRERTGVPEFVLAEGKSPDETVAALGALAAGGRGALATRVPAGHVGPLERAFPQGVWHERARLFALEDPQRSWLPGEIGVVSAGTADVGVAEEAAVTAEFLGSRVARVYDVGVAGLHRLLGQRDFLASLPALVVVAGMEGALPSVVGGLVSASVVAVPTSVGYGSGFAGLAALLAMLNSCAPGVTVVNVDNGFGAGVAAHRIHRASVRGAGA